MRSGPAFRLLACLAVAAVTPQLQAQAAVDTLPDSAARSLELEDAAAGRRARLWSLGATLIPMVAMPLSVDDSGYPNMGAVMIAGLGMYLGPAAGYWIEGQASRGWAGVGIRFGSAMAGGMVAALVMGDGTDTLTASQSSIASAAMFGSMIGIVVSIVHDIRVVDDHVRRVRANERKRAASLTIAPMLSPATSTAGFRAALTF